MLPNMSFLCLLPPIMILLTLQALVKLLNQLFGRKPWLLNFLLYNNRARGHLFQSLLSCMWLADVGCISSNIIMMAPLLAIKCGWLKKGFVKLMELITLKHSVLWLNKLQFE